MKSFHSFLQTNPNNQEIYAGFMVRLVATFIDMIITAPIIWAAFHIIGFDMSHLPTLEQMMAGVEPVKNSKDKIADFISWTISITYSVYFITSKQQATPGKRIMNIYIATKDGKKLSVNRCFARFFASILSGLLLGVGFIMIAFTKEKTALHDLICNTRVFYGKK
ncbi:MAG: RDD family protein [Pseudomonadota bacterium]